MDITAERNDILLRMNDYKMSEEYLKAKVPEQKVIVKAVTASEKQLTYEVYL